MKKLLTILTLLVLTGSFVLADQTPGHIAGGKLAYDLCHGNLPYEEITMPLVLIGTHIVQDHYIGEGNLGDNPSDQILVNGLFVVVGHLLMGEGTKEQRLYDYIAMWSAILPDTLLKPLVHYNSGMGAWLPEEQHTIDYSHQQEVEMIGLELISFKYLF